MEPPRVVVMGVTGSGKSTLGARLAQALSVPFCEGDALHPPANVAKMRAGLPLDDGDRAPWLARINAWMREHAGGVVSCSALKRAYRDRLRDGLCTPFALVLLDPPREEIERRLAAREGHFMPPSLLDSQLDALERPFADEHALVLQGSDITEPALDAVVAWLASRSSLTMS